MRLGFLVVTAVSLSGCYGWVPPLPETPANLTLAVATVSLLSDENPTPVSPEEARRRVEGASKIWEDACGIRLRHAKHFEKDSEAIDVTDAPSGYAEVDEVQEALFVEGHLTVGFIRKITVPFQAENPGGIATLPWLPGAASAAVLATEASTANTLAHELGHAFGLEHTDEDDWESTRSPLNLMFPVYGGDARKRLEAVQCEQAIHYLLGFESLQYIERG